MFYEEKWYDGWLWIRTNPREEYRRATNEQIILHLVNRVAYLERQLSSVEEKQDRMGSPDRSALAMTTIS